MRIITYIITFYYNHFYLDLDQLSFVQQNLSDSRLSKKEPRKKSEFNILFDKIKADARFEPPVTPR